MKRNQRKRKTRSNETSHQKLRFQTFLCPLTRPSDTLSKSGEGNKADCSVCGKNVDENMMFSPLTLTFSLTEVNLTGRGKCIIVRSTVKDSSQFTIHYSLILMQTLCLPLSCICSTLTGRGKSC